MVGKQQLADGLRAVRELQWLLTEDPSGATIAGYDRAATGEDRIGYQVGGASGVFTTSDAADPSGRPMLHELLDDTWEGFEDLLSFVVHCMERIAAGDEHLGKFASLGLWRDQMVYDVEVSNWVATLDECERLMRDRRRKAYFDWSSDSSVDCPEAWKAHGSGTAPSTSTSEPGA